MKGLPLGIVKKDRTSKIEKKHHFLINKKYGRLLIVHFGNYLLSVTPPSALKGPNDFSWALKQFQDKYIVLSEQEQWSDKMIKTIIWNICENQERFPNKIETYEIYKERYFNGSLRPYPGGENDVVE